MVSLIRTTALEIPQPPSRSEAPAARILGAVDLSARLQLRTVDEGAATSAPRCHLNRLHADARTDADYTTMAIDETTVQEALAIAREILEVVQRYKQ